MTLVTPVRGGVRVPLIAFVLGLVLFSFNARGANNTIVVQSGDVESLYAVVRNPANVNKTVVLQPGIYILSATAPSGVPRPRGGGLLLQEGMKLLGSNVYADADHDGVWDASFDGNPVIAGNTVIDGTGVAPEAFGPDFQPEVDCVGATASELLAVGAALLYRNRGTISGITILAAPGQFALGPAHSALLPSRGYFVEINNTFLDGGFSAWGGAAFHNMGCRMRNASSTLLFDHNITRGSLFGLTVVNGLTNQQGDEVQGPSVHAILTRNHVIANILMGLHARNSLGTDGGWVDVQSTGNLFEGNATGLEVTAGTNNGAQSSGTIGNQLDLVSARDTFRQNSTGVLGVAGWLEDPFNPLSTSRNELRITLRQGTFEGGDALHAWSMFPEARPNIDIGNRVTALVRDSSSDTIPIPPFVFVDRVPGDSNTVSIVGSDAAFLSSNRTPPTYSQYLVPPNPFDLAGATNKLHFTPAATGYQLTAQAGALDPDFGSALDFSGDPNGDFPLDDDTTEVFLPFAFPFEGRSYTSAFVNTDGNLTFGEGDFASTPRDVARLVSGAPRIAALLSDLAPNIGGSVHAKALPERVVITWDHVPSWPTLADENTLQIALHADGTVDLIYGGIGITDAVVGIAPGGNSGNPPPAVDLSAGAATGSTLYEDFFGIRGP